MMITTTHAGTARHSWRRGAASLGIAAVAVLSLGTAPAVGTVTDDPSVTNINNDYTVPQGGQWTFQATGFASDGTLSVYLDNPDGTLLRTYALDAEGDAGTVPPDYTRVPIASTVAAGDYTLVFEDNEFNEVQVPITVTVPAAVTVSSGATATVGGDLTVTGSGWLTTDPDKGAQVALKIESATDSAVTYNHLTGEAVPGSNDNLTIWVIVEADENGDFSVDVDLPDGTNAGEYGSNPVFGSGDYKIRALAGSLNPPFDRAGVALGNVFTVSEP
ncbi:MAG: hypothetical protein LBJ02_12305 [Bifidobacteriaceae bacterium]|jgi:hypothetical protein|nr:hypothetical protein [Bifidobacteriaceae bacterium]